MHWMSQQKSASWSNPETAEQFAVDMANENSMGCIAFNKIFHSIVEDYFVTGNIVVDVGCGTGLTSCFVHDLGCQVIAVDISDDMIKKLNELKGDRIIECRLGNAFALPASDREADVVVSRMFMTHFPDYYMILREMARVVKPGGFIIYSFSSAEHHDAATAWRKVDRSNFPLSPEFDGHHYSTLTDVKNLKRLCQSIDLEVVKVVPMGLFYDNAIVAASLGAEKFDSFNQSISNFLKNPDIMEFMIWLDQFVTPNLPPFMAYHNVTILRKRP